MSSLSLCISIIQQNNNRSVPNSIARRRRRFRPLNSSAAMGNIFSPRCFYGDWPECLDIPGDAHYDCIQGRSCPLLAGGPHRSASLYLPGSIGKRSGACRTRPVDRGAAACRPLCKVLQNERRSNRLKENNKQVVVAISITPAGLHHHHHQPLEQLSLDETCFICVCKFAWKTRDSATQRVPDRQPKVLSLNKHSWVIQQNLVWFFPFNKIQLVSVLILSLWFRHFVIALFFITGKNRTRGEMVRLICLEQGRALMINLWIYI